jgi:hypothetical protein
VVIHIIYICIYICIHIYIQYLLFPVFATLHVLLYVIVRTVESSVIDCATGTMIDTLYGRCKIVRVLFIPLKQNGVEIQRAYRDQEG